MSVPPPPDDEPLAPPVPPVPPYPPQAPPAATQHRRPLLILGANLAGVLLVCAAVYWTLTTFAGPGTAPSARAYRLTVPGTLAGGRYVLVTDLSDTPTGGGSATDPDNLVPVGGMYRAGTGDADIVTYLGGYGRVPHPALYRAFLLTRLTQRSGVVGSTEPETLTAAGTHETVYCEVLTMRDTPRTMPVCVWDDTTTAITVTETTALTADLDPTAVDLQPLADLTGKVIDEVRAPAG